MSTPVLNFSEIKTLFTDGMKHARKKYKKGLFSDYSKLCDYQLSLVNKANDMNTLFNATSLINPVLDLAYKGPKPLCSGCEIQKTVPQFGVGRDLEWYFIYGITGSYCFTITLGRKDIAPMDIVNGQGIDPSEAVRWSFKGGCGKIGGEWYHLPDDETLYMKYTQPSSNTFSLSGSGSKIKNALFQTTQENPVLTTLNPLQFKNSISFIDEKGNSHDITITMIATSPAVPFQPNSCFGCENNAGTLYYSYTNMDIIVQLDKEPMETGKGWIDHQVISNSIPRSIWGQAKLSVLNTLLKPMSGGWLWISIQDYETNIQYMLVHLFSTKYYQDAIKPDKDISMEVINVYKEGIAHFNPTRTDIASSDVKVQMIQTASVNGVNLPYKYNITLPGGKKVVLKIASTPSAFIDAFSSYENPALLYNEDMSKLIGSGIIEANGYQTNDWYAKRYVKMAGGDDTNQNELNIISNGMSPNLTQTGFQRFLAFLILLIPLWLIIIAIIFIRNKKDNRSSRLAIVIAIGLILYGVSYQMNSN